MLQSVETLEKTRGGRIFLVIVLTILWWACAVGVTVAIKDALGAAAQDERGSFPFPLTLTLFANIGTALATGAIAAALHGCADYMGIASTIGERRPHVLRVTSREALLDAAEMGGGANETFEIQTPHRSHVPPGLFQSRGRTPPMRDDAYVEQAQDIGALGGQPCGASDDEGVCAQVKACLASCWDTLGSIVDGGRGTIMLIGLLQGLSLGVKNEALLFLSVSTRTMIFATNVLAVMMMAGLFGLEHLRKTKVIAGVLLAAGGMLQGLKTIESFTHGDGPTDDPLGCALAVLALLLDASRWVLLQAAFKAQASQAPENPGGQAGGSRRPPGGIAQMSKFSMVSWVMWMATPVCLTLSVIFEPDGLQLAVQQPLPILGLISALTVGVIGINVAEFGVVQWTSAVTFNVLSQLHSIPMVLVGIIWFGEEVVFVQVLGFSVCLVGAILYSYARAREQEELAPERLEEDGR